MNSLTQYIELFNSNRQSIERHSSSPLNAPRQKALDALYRIRRLPEKGDEGYEKTSINDMLAPDYGININRMDFPVDVAATFRCDVPNISTLLGVVVNDTFKPTSTLLNNLPEGVKVMSLNQAGIQMPGLVEKYYGSVASGDNAACALNTLLAQDGVLVHVDRDVHLDKAIQIVNIFNATRPVMGVRRMLIVMEEGSQARILTCDHSKEKDVDYLSNQVIEIVMHRNSSLDFYDIEESSSRTSRLSHLYARQEQGSVLTINGITLIGGNTRNDYDIAIQGKDCGTHLAGMVIGTDSQHTDNSSNVVHHAPGCQSDQLFKYVLDDRSSGAFEGSIVVDEGAVFTQAYQTNRNMLASTTARMHTKPQLEIYCDEVKCSHGATTGQIDERAMFYMRSRGIPEKEARLMLMQAFMSDVIDTVRLDALRDRLRHLVEKRLTGDKALCSECSASCK